MYGSFVKKPTDVRGGIFLPRNPREPSPRTSRFLQLFDSHFEMTLTKSIGLFVEAVPGTIVQLAAITRSGSNTSSTAAFSLACCLMTVAFASSNMSHDWDTGKHNRKSVPYFYGYVPDKAKGKVLMFVSFYYLSAFNLLARALTCVLLQLKGGGGDGRVRSPQ